MSPERAYLGVVLLLVGGGLALTGLHAIPTRTQPSWGWPEWALAYLSVFRRVVVGLCVMGAGIGWAAQVPWLLAASVCVGLGELLESSYYIGVLRWGQRRGSIRSMAGRWLPARRIVDDRNTVGADD